MRAVVQRVRSASVTIDDVCVSQIKTGLLILLGIGHADDRAKADYLANKIVGLRVFEDDAGLMNLDVSQVAGSLLVVSQFTLYGDCRKGRRPSFVDAMPPQQAEPLYEYFVSMCQKLSGVPVQTGRFGAMMAVDLCNWGPVTLQLEV